MAKKQKRNVSQSTATTSSLPKATATPAPSSRYATSAEFNPDYTYVKKDLKRIGSLAGSFILLLVVLSFFLR